jgi:hypothetical protein
MRKTTFSGTKIRGFCLGLLVFSVFMLLQVAPAAATSSVPPLPSPQLPPWLNNCLSPLGTGVGDPACPGNGMKPTLPVAPPPPTGNAECSDCTCIIDNGMDEQLDIQTWGLDERDTFETDMYQFEQWMVTQWFHDYVMPAMMNMTEFLTTVGLYQVQVFGQFLDAKDQMETERLMQSMAADAHARYQPDLDMCNIGTAARGLGAAHRNAEYTAFLLSQRSQDRQLGNNNGSGTEGRAGDRTDRVQLLKKRYCDIYENDFSYGNTNAAIPSFCGTTEQALTINRDIDFTRVIDTNMTLDVDFSDGVVTSDEQDLIALEDNLFAHDIFDRLGNGVLALRDNQPLYLEARSVVAKRSVAENSFLAIAGMKSAGGGPSTNTAPYVAAVFQQMGVNAVESKLLVGTHPSYYALLDVLASRIYQNPEFFVNLYDTPANVARKDVAMQAIDLMLGRDMFKSELRSEADMAVWLELELIQIQHNPVQNHIDWLEENGRQD